MEIVPSWPAVRREVVIAMPLRAARVVPWGAFIVAIVREAGWGEVVSGVLEWVVGRVCSMRDWRREGGMRKGGMVWPQWGDVGGAMRKGEVEKEVILRHPDARSHTAGRACLVFRPACPCHIVTSLASRFSISHGGLINCEGSSRRPTPSGMA